MEVERRLILTYMTCAGGPNRKTENRKRTNVIHLLIDVGNGRVKMGLASAQAILDRRELPTAGLTAAQITEKLSGWSFDSATLCSVVPAAIPAFQEALGDRLHVLTCGTDLRIGIRYPQPASIGADRLANAVALAGLYGAELPTAHSAATAPLPDEPVPAPKITRCF